MQAERVALATAAAQRDRTDPATTAAQLQDEVEHDSLQCAEATRDQIAESVGAGLDSAVSDTLPVTGVPRTSDSSDLLNERWWGGDHS